VSFRPWPYRKLLEWLWNWYVAANLDEDYDDAHDSQTTYEVQIMDDIMLDMLIRTSKE
jgi:hypothetical protein